MERQIEIGVVGTMTRYPRSAEIFVNIDSHDYSHQSKPGDILCMQRRSLIVCLETIYDHHIKSFAFL